MSWGKKEAGGRGRAGGDESSLLLLPNQRIQVQPAPLQGVPLGSHPARGRCQHPARKPPPARRVVAPQPLWPFPVASPGKGAARSQPAQPPAQARQPKYLQEALPSMGTATRHRVHMPQQCLIKLPNSKGIPLRLSEDKLGARLLSGNAGTGKEQSLFFLLNPE